MKWSGKDAAGGAASGAATGSSFGPWGALIGGAVGGIGGGLIGGEARAKEEEQRRKQRKAMEAAMAAIQNVKAPQYRDVTFGNMQGDYNTNSDFANMGIDQGLKNRQMAQLSALDVIQKGGGLTEGDRANWQRYQMGAAEADRGRREAIQQTMAKQGMASSGNSLLAQLQSSQAATNQASQQGADLAGLAQQRALEATMKQGQLAGDIRGQDFSQQAQIAAAKDAMAKFNTQNRIDKDKFNIQQNDKTQTYYNDLQKMSFDGQMRQAEAIAKMYGIEADFQGVMAQGSAKERGEMLNGLFQLGASYFANQDKAEQNKREDYAFRQQYPNYPG